MLKLGRSVLADCVFPDYEVPDFTGRLHSSAS